MNQLLTLNDLKNLSKFSLASGNAVIPLFQYFTLGREDIFSFKTAQVFTGSLLMAMASQAFNQVIEWKQDKMMTRTCNRPIPIEKLTRFQGGVIGGLFFLASNGLMYNNLPTQALVINNLIFFSYLGLYTPLKTRSPTNTFVGAIVGALPVILGAACIEGQSLKDIGIWGNFGFMLTWQINHFYGIYWKYQKDYQRAGFKMLNDSVQASKQMKACLVLNAASWIATAKSHSEPQLQIISGIAGAISLYLWNWKAIKQFEIDPTKNANYLKRASYYFFLVYYGMLTVDIGLRRTH